MGAIKQILCELLLSCSVAAGSVPSVADLTYGTLLFDYYQQDYQAALLQTMIAESRQRRGSDTTRFDLAAGSFAFADGMYRYAMHSFDQVAAHELQPLDRLRLGFHLSREYYRRGDWNSMGEQLSSLEQGLAAGGSTHPEVSFMRAEHALAVGRIAEARLAVQQIPVESKLRAYGLFNLGVALRADDQPAGARRAFAEAAAIAAYDQEALDLSQRAKLALAYMARDEQDARSAQAVLEALPAEGRYQTVALAAFGRLAMQREHHELAARIWLSLQRADDWSTAGAAARLGLPLAVHGLAASDRANLPLALSQYRAAERSFELRLHHLQDLVRSTRDPQWIAGVMTMLTASPEQQGDAMQHWEQQFSHADWLAWLARDDINQLLGQWDRLTSMQQWLGGTARRVDALQQVAAERIRRSGQARLLLHDDGLLARRSALAAQHVALGARLDALQAATAEPVMRWMLPLAEPPEAQLLQDLQRMGELSQRLPAEDRARLKARIDRLQGLVFYRLAEQRAKRIQVLRKQQRAAAEEVAALDRVIARVQAAQSVFQSGVGADFAGFVERAAELEQVVEHARSRREALMAAQIEQRLQQESAHIQRLLLATRVAIARATDQLASADVEMAEGES